MWELDNKEGRVLKNWCFWTVVLGITLESSLDARRSNQSTLKKINPEYLLEGLMLKLQYFGYLMQGADSLEKNPDARKDWRQKEKRVTENEMVGWHHWLNGHEFEEALEDGEGQGSLACCSPWGPKEFDMTEWLSNNNLPRRKKDLTCLSLPNSGDPRAFYIKVGKIGNKKKKSSKLSFKMKVCWLYLYES